MDADPHLGTGYRGNPKGKAKSTISYAYSKSTLGDFAETSSFKRSEQLWPTKQGRPAIPGVVIYAGVDGSFSAWDPARNYWQGDGKEESAERVRAFNFTPEQVWNGLEGPGGIRYCNGLIHDWVLCGQKGQDPAFADLCKVLEALSASDDEQLVPGQPVRLGLDVKDYPAHALWPRRGLGARLGWHAAHRGTGLSVGLDLARASVGL